MKKPPPVIDGATVMEWAWSDQPFGVVHSEQGMAIPIHGLAICQYSSSSGVYRFACNIDWETEQDADYRSLEEAQSFLPEQYRQAPITWTKYS